MDDKKPFEAEVTLQIAEAKKLVCRFREGISQLRLDKLEQDIRAAFKCALKEKTIPIADEERIQRCMGRQSWEKAKALNPNITIVDHVYEVYPDRIEIGMLRKDLNDPRVDPKLYQALADWLRPKSDGSRNELPSDFGLPKRSDITDISIRDLDAISDNLSSAASLESIRLARAVNASRTRSYRRKISQQQIPRAAAE